MRFLLDFGCYLDPKSWACLPAVTFALKNSATVVSLSVTVIAGTKLNSGCVGRLCALRVQASGKGEPEGSEPSRLVQDALEFNNFATSPKQASAQAPMQQEEHQPGDLLGGKYQVVKLLAKGKSGLVYKVSCSPMSACQYSDGLSSNIDLLPWLYMLFTVRP